MPTGADALTIEELAGALRAATTLDPAMREGWRKSGAAFFLRNSDGPPAVALARSQAAIWRTTGARHRLQLGQARHDARLSSRSWQVKRRARTLPLIELGGLVVKADLVALTDDQHASILGVLIEAAGEIRSKDGAPALAI